ncbi:MAG: ABC transporter permease, partial [Rhodospirillales bacterium]|nr:ABC transporter permease [Rhodospirillales bacterium]
MSASALPSPSKLAGTSAQSPARLAWARFRRRRAAVLGLGVVTVFLLVAIFAPLIAPYDPIATSWSLIRKAPSWAHWMGTDENGRDVLSRVVFGAQASMLAGVVSVSIAAGIGVPTGLLAGFAGGVTD